MYSLGYIKDCIAFTLFVFILFLIIKIDNINKYKIYFILGLLLAIIADGTFSSLGFVFLDNMTQKLSFNI